MFQSTRGFKVLLSLIIGPYLPFLVGLSREDVRRLFPYFEKNFYEILRESGYLHIQATKPDTAGGDTLHGSHTGIITLTEFIDEPPEKSHQFLVFCNLSALIQPLVLL